MFVGQRASFPSTALNVSDLQAIPRSRMGSRGCRVLAGERAHHMGLQASLDENMEKEDIVSVAQKYNT